MNALYNNMHPYVLGYAAKEAKDIKFYGDKAFISLVYVANCGRYILVPFTMEDKGRFGAHAHAFLLGLARMAIKVRRHNRPLCMDSFGGILKGAKVTPVSPWIHN
jgi:hypothetical protein